MVKSKKSKAKKAADDFIPFLDVQTPKKVTYKPSISMASLTRDEFTSMVSSGREHCDNLRYGKCRATPRIIKRDFYDLDLKNIDHYYMEYFLKPIFDAVYNAIYAKLKDLNQQARILSRKLNRKQRRTGYDGNIAIDNTITKLYNKLHTLEPTPTAYVQSVNVDTNDDW